MEKTKYDGNQIVSWDKCDWKPVEITPTKIAKMSEAIRAGCKMVGELRTGWQADNCACALGTALWAVGERDCHISFVVFEAIDKHFSIPREVCEEASKLHYSGKFNREQIADWLESRGY